jgi:hypothetical protein
MSVLELKPTAQTEPTVKDDKIVPLKPRLYEIPYHFEIPHLAVFKGTIIAPVTPQVEKMLSDFVNSMAAQTAFIFMGMLTASATLFFVTKSIQILISLFRL